MFVYSFRNGILDVRKVLQMGINIGLETGKDVCLFSMWCILTANHASKISCKVACRVREHHTNWHIDVHYVKLSAHVT